MLHLKEEVQDTIVLSCLVGNPRAALRRVEGLLTKVTQSAADVVVVTQFVFWMSTRQLLSALACCLQVVEQCFSQLTFGTFLQVDGTEDRLNLRWLQVLCSIDTWMIKQRYLMSLNSLH